VLVLKHCKADACACFVILEVEFLQKIQWLLYFSVLFDHRRPIAWIANINVIAPESPSSRRDSALQERESADVV